MVVIGMCVSASDKATSGCRGGRRVCAGCGAPIRDQYILRVAPDLEWHAACLKCADCHQFLDETCTCFVRDGKTYCKRDYVRLFGTKCSKCRQGFSRTDFVMRARQHVYHLDCFRCQACARQLIPGDEFALREDGLFCRADHDVLDKFASSAAGGGPATATGPTNGIHVAPNAEPLPVGGPGVPRAGGQAGAWRNSARPASRPPAEQAAAARRRHGGGRRRRPAVAAAAAAQADSGADGAEREAAAHAAHLLRGQPEAGRAHEGAAGRDDGPLAAGHPGLVPEQALQGQEEEPPHEADAAA
ncbi:hypothetical protein HPB48_001849 [Haemaphysalis longicornis]|uniref:LIM zinc-binding domain-containing protein n=1 Tax=Haemaphysalis longicornis TaxID=44386 RepID=A0A9J6G6A3_HAELO|nr:hypothetical protein HPB48_001849 [Haemaphysalis longicornis]